MAISLGLNLLRLFALLFASNDDPQELFPELLLLIGRAIFHGKRRRTFHVLRGNRSAALKFLEAWRKILS